MQGWICVTCGTQFAQSEMPPTECPICRDQRQYIGHEGQKWTTLPALQKDQYHNVFKEYEPYLTSISTSPSFAIGQHALLLQTDEGNVLWDCISLLDEETIANIQQRGGVQAIAISHPHFYTTMIEWANRFNAPIYLHEADRQWVMRPNERITFWSGNTFLLRKDITLLNLGGHFAGSSVLHYSGGANGKGILLTGDTIQVGANPHWVSFMYSYPNFIPLPATEIHRIRDIITHYEFERIYGMNVGRVVSTDAKNVVIRSANRYMEAMEHRLSDQSVA